MLETNNNIIIVDDNKEHLQYLANVFCHYGIGCRTILYDGFPDIDAPLENVKLAFFDITLTEAGDENAQMAVLRDALKTYISPKNKAFALVFWTNRPEYKDKFVKFVNRSEDKAEIPKPLCVEVIDKNEFLEHEEEIEQRLSDLMDENIIKCLFSFDSELKQASEKSLSEILDLIEFPDDWGENERYVENIRDVFALIAIETFGDKRGKNLTWQSRRRLVLFSYTIYAIFTQLYGKISLEEKTSQEFIIFQMQRLQQSLIQYFIWIILKRSLMREVV